MVLGWLKVKHSIHGIGSIPSKAIEGQKAGRRETTKRGEQERRRETETKRERGRERNEQPPTSNLFMQSLMLYLFL